MSKKKRYFFKSCMQHPMPIHRLCWVILGDDVTIAGRGAGAGPKALPRTSTVVAPSLVRLPCTAGGEGAKVAILSMRRRRRGIRLQELVPFGCKNEIVRPDILDKP